MSWTTDESTLIKNKNEKVPNFMNEMIKHTNMKAGDQKIKLKSKGSKVTVTTGIRANLTKY